ncbi:MAG: MBL fold metallo-hydrolase [Spirochaetaceae bacterium]|jgi:phosphoribosyl 1,2-cyclic phosphodiesterase|nr:MBL fold metallo-hydrolase [Spirochaetaceae bacterium]GMO17102.1 MAG: MBL fold metallo-hydrolase [Termitinemataceae bacterium]
MLSVRFWGVRGSIACPGSSTLRFGGNTACLEICADERLIIVDMGTGIFRLGAHLVSNGLKKGPIEADVFITHTHIDHLIGFQMFTPFFIDKTKIRMYGPVLPNNVSIQKIISDQMSYNLWPVRLRELTAEIMFYSIGEAVIDLGGGLSVCSKYLNHPVVCLGYRFMYQGKSITTAFDNEVYWNIFNTENNDDFFFEDARRSGEIAVREENKKLISFYKDTNILIYDSAYTQDEYNAGKQHWGHSTFTNAVKAANEANVEKLVLFHHDPSRSDEELARIETECKTVLNARDDLEIIAGREGMTIVA